MANKLTDRTARMVVSIAGEPGDERVGHAVAEHGALAKRKWRQGDVRFGNSSVGFTTGYASC